MEVLNSLDPQAAATFTTGVVQAVDRRTKQPGLLDAVLRGFAVKERKYETKVKGLEVEWDSRHLNDFLKGKLDGPYANLLIGMCRHLTSTRSNQGDTQWDADEVEEFVENVRRLPGGGNADVLTEDLRRSGEEATKPNPR